MSIPSFDGKHDEPAFMTPATRLEHRYGDGEWPTVPDAVVLTFQEYLFDEVADRPDAWGIDLGTDTYSVYALGDADGEVGVAGGFGIGAPKLAIVVEELRALGADLFCIVGGCATLQPAVSPGDVVVADSAIRDEGTSHHYLEPAETVAATPAFVRAIERHADAAGIAAHTGPTWTTDGFYRETAAEIEHYADEGVLTVEMEAAALFAVARYREAAAGAVFTPFDRLTGDEWDVPGDSPEDRLLDAFSLAVAAGRDAIDG